MTIFNRLGGVFQAPATRLTALLIMCFLTAGAGGSIVTHAIDTAQRVTAQASMTPVDGPRSEIVTPPASGPQSETVTVPTPAPTVSGGITASPPPLVLKLGQSITTGPAYGVATIEFDGCIDTNNVPGFSDTVHEIDCTFFVSSSGPASAYVNLGDWQLVDMDGIALSSNMNWDHGAASDVQLPAAGGGQDITLYFHVTVADISPVCYVTTGWTNTYGQPIEWEIDQL